MTLVEIAKEASSLSEEERASLATALLGSLGLPNYDISDEEVARRRLEAENDPNVMISYEELKSRLGK